VESPGEREYRISDADREHVADALRHAAGEGRLSIDELEQRLEEAYAAKTYGELVPLTADLPGQETLPAQSVVRRGGSLAPRIGGVATSSSSIAVFGGSERKGPWVVPQSYTAFAMFGGVRLDLREATFAAPEVTINASAVLGGVDIIAPYDIRLVVDGSGILGGFEEGGDAGTPPPPGAPVVRVKGVAILGGVSVKRKGRSRAE
jgi:hypothetical protein